MPADDDRSEVLTSLPRSRPQRRSAKRSGGGEASADGGAGAPEAAGAKPAPKPKAAPRPRPVGAGMRSDDPPARPVEPPSLLNSVVRAAEEFSQVGATIGREAVRSVLRRLRP